MIWKNLDNVYKVSEYGDIKSVDRYVKQKNRTYWVKGKELNHNIDSGGYHRVGLSLNGKRKYESVHRLVGKLFVENRDNKPEINHIDGNKSNNHYSNLEWSTRSENIKHAVDNDLMTHLVENSKVQRKPVFKIDADGNEFHYNSLAEASKQDGISISYLSQIVNGDRPQKKCCHWAFAEPVEELE